MEFQLPSVLQKKLTPYDEVRRKQEAEKKRLINKAKKPFHLGLPPIFKLIPTDVLPKNRDRVEIIKQISSNELSYRYQELCHPPVPTYGGEARHTNGKPLTFAKTDRLVHTTSGIRVQRRLLVYHFEGMWTCVWLPHTNKYVYGYSFAFRDTLANGRRYCSFIDHHDYGVKTVSDGSNADKKVFLVPNQYNDEDKKKRQALGDKAFWGYSWNDCLPVQVGKTNWRYMTVYVTKEMIRNGHDYDISKGVYTDREIESWHNKSSNLCNQLRDWRDALKNSLPNWKSAGNDYYGRRYDNIMFNRIFPEQNTLGYVIKKNYELKQKNWNHGYSGEVKDENNYLILDPMKKWDVDSLKSLIFRLTNKEPLDLYERRHNIGDTFWKENGWIEQPYFRKMLHFALKHAEDRLAASGDQSMEWVTAPIERMIHMSDWVRYILYVWPDTPVDYFQSYEKYLLKVNVPVEMGKINYYRGRLNESNNYIETKMNMIRRKKEYFGRMPVKTFFEFVKKRSDEYDIEGHKSSYDFNHRMDEHMCEMREWTDTVNLMDDILGNQYKDQINYDAGAATGHEEDKIQEIDRPRRWRLTELHDHLMGIQWKSNHEDFGLPQDLFPKPVKVTWQDAYANNDLYQSTRDLREVNSGTPMWSEYENSTFSFFQPLTSHQLADWGRAVRNCVGNSGYASAISKKRYFIVLAMLDHKPRYTIQLKLSDGTLMVDQIADIGNRRLSDIEKDFVQKSIAVALQRTAEEDPNYQPKEEN